MSPSYSCDPYTQTGILQVDLKTYRNNRFVALNVEPSCQPMNYMDLLHDGGEPVELEWLRGKTVVLYGDSVDREYVVSSSILLLLVAVTECY